MLHYLYLSISLYLSLSLSLSLSSSFSISLHPGARGDTAVALYSQSVDIVRVIVRGAPSPIKSNIATRPNITPATTVLPSRPFPSLPPTPSRQRYRVVSWIFLSP